MNNKKVIEYTEKELAAIEVLKMNSGSKLTAKELGIPSCVLTSLINKAKDERPMADGTERFIIETEKLQEN